MARSFVAASVATLAVALGACDRGPSTEAFRGPTMGTTYTVKTVTPSPLGRERRAAVEAAIAGILAEVDAATSTYRDDSELARFNAHRETTPFPVSRATAETVAVALEVAERSGGCLDVTVGPLVAVWGFGPGGGSGEAPDEARLAALRGRVGWRKLELDRAASTLRKTDPEVAVDLSSVAPGYAVDRIAAALAELGIADVMVELGGELRAAGRNGQGEVWRIGIESPDPAARGLQRIVPLRDAGLATSGDYRNYREVAGERVSHIIDPRTGRPIRHGLASATVIHPSCAAADAWATALMVLGPEDALATAEEQGLAALLVVHDGDGFRERTSTSFDNLPP